jgi:hypothetical protein
MLIYVGSRYIEILTLVVDRGAWSDSHSGHNTPLKVPQYPLNIKMGGPQNQAGYYREQKSNWSLPGFIVQIIQASAWLQF